MKYFYHLWMKTATALDIGVIFKYIKRNNGEQISPVFYCTTQNAQNKPVKAQKILNK